MFHLESFARGCRFRLTRRLASRHPTEVWPDLNETTVLCKPFVTRFGNVKLYELLVLCAVSKQINAQRLFEFGTFNGLTTWHLAANCGPMAQVYTLDLPLNHPARLRNVHDRSVGKILGISVGEYYHSSPERNKVSQILEDSQNFDCAPYRGSMDFCFIDASHEYVHVCRDTQNALAMARTGGVIFWHDYSRWWPGVQKCLDNLSRSLPVFRITNTSLVALIVPAREDSNQLIFNS